MYPVLVANVGSSIGRCVRASQLDRIKWACQLEKTCMIGVGVSSAGSLTGFIG